MNIAVQRITEVQTVGLVSFYLAPCNVINEIKYRKIVGSALQLIYIGTATEGRHM
jgi:hypothetical protein